MAEILKLKHINPNELPDQKFYFYEGEVDVHFGVIELPRSPDFTHWAQRAWMKGFRLDPETGREVSREELDVLLAGGSLDATTESPKAEAPAAVAPTKAPARPSPSTNKAKSKA